MLRNRLLTLAIVGSFLGLLRALAPAAEQRLVWLGLIALPLGYGHLLGAAVFAAAHGYGVAGFGSVFASGLLWSIAYERTGSLLPGMAAHAANNVSAACAVLALLRL